MNTQTNRETEKQTNRQSKNKEALFERLTWEKTIQKYQTVKDMQRNFSQLIMKTISSSYLKDSGNGRSLPLTRLVWH